MNQLSPKAKTLFVLNNLMGALLFAVIILGISSGMLISLSDQLTLKFFFLLVSVLIAIIITLLIISYIWAVLKYKYYKYQIDEKGIQIESGIVSKKYITIPYNKIQNVEIYRSLLERILGLSHISIQTAGYGATGGYSRSGSEGNLPGLEQGIALEIKNELTHQIAK